MYLLTENAVPRHTTHKLVLQLTLVESIRLLV